MTLETAFYTFGIIFMSIMLVLLIALVTAVFVIKTKLNHMHRALEDKLHGLTNIADIGMRGAVAAQNVIKKVRRHR